MKMEDLETANSPKPLDFPHFPTRWQAVLWRNWGLVPVERLEGLSLPKTLREGEWSIQVAGIPDGEAFLHEAPYFRSPTPLPASGCMRCSAISIPSPEPRNTHAAGKSAWRT